MRHVLHLDQARDVSTRTNGCEECLKTGDHWRSFANVSHLRPCWMLRLRRKISMPKHFTRPFALILSLEPSEDWIWCYIDQAMLEPA